MNKTPNLRWRITGCLTATALLAAACTTGSADGPTSPSISASVTATPSVADVPTSGTSTTPSSDRPRSSQESTTATGTTASVDPAAREIADRTAVEEAWAKFWKVNDTLVRVPDSQRIQLASTVAVGPSLTQMLQDARSLESDGLDYFGNSQYHPYWEQSIAGKSTTVMGDCTDTSNAGSLEVSTGKHRTVGVPDNNTRVTFCQRK